MQRDSSTQNCTPPSGRGRGEEMTNERHAHLLVAEDDQHNRQVLTEMLESEGTTSQQWIAVSARWSSFTELSTT